MAITAGLSYAIYAILICKVRKPPDSLPTAAHNDAVPQRQQVEAALSAAVTTTKPIGERTHLAGGTK